MTKTKLYDLVIRIPVFSLDGRLVGEPQTVLPGPAPGALGATTTTPREDMSSAVLALEHFAREHGVEILGGPAGGDARFMNRLHELALSLEHSHTPIVRAGGDELRKILQTRTATIAQPKPGETMEVGVGDAKEMPPGLADALGEELRRR